MLPTRPVFLLLLLSVHLIEAIEWLSIGLLSWKEGTDRNACRNLKGLTKRQLRFCRRNTDVIGSIAIGAETAYMECQYQFKKRRDLLACFWWNCTLLEERGEERGRGLAEATREAAFVHAISAAGVAHRVTKDCSRGLSERCGCDHTKHRRHREMSYEFEGCSDNVQYGIGVSREFIDAAERARNSTELATINLHNNRAGREVLEKSLRRECKCHGMSGSCEAKTCWNSMPNFREIGQTIKEKFDGASEVNVVADEAKPRIVMKNNQLKRHTHADLVYMKPSPDYCERDEKSGILGTRGRVCNASSLALDGCQLMCCNRGFLRQERIVVEKCHCKFIYCCRVECANCTRIEENHVCL